MIRFLSVHSANWANGDDGSLTGDQDSVFDQDSSPSPLQAMPSTGSGGGWDLAGAVSETLAGEALASAIPNGSDAEIAFISGATSNATVASTSFAMWNGNNPATYGTTGFADKWGSTTLSTNGTPGGNVTYWFDAASNWTTPEENAFIAGLTLWSAEANISFSLAPSAGAAQQIFYRGAAGSGAFQSFTSATEATAGSGTFGHAITSKISIDTSQPYWQVGTSFDNAGGYAWQTLVHEEGHMLGFGHGGPYNGSVNSSTQQFSAYDTRLWTLMSYIDPFDTTAKFYNSYPVTGTTWGVNSQGYSYEPTTPMILDVLAAQRIYGAATSGPLAGGGQTFGFHTNLSGPIAQYFDFTINQHPVITIWDGGVNNALDLSGWSTTENVNLTPGAFSSCDGMTNNIGIAEGTTINTAICGSGNDTITGNSANNIIDGGAGTNTFVETGNHTGYNFQQLGTGYFQITDARTGAPDGTDQVKNIQNIQFADGTFAIAQLPHSLPVLNDLNGDGRSDILWHNTSGAVGIWEMSPTGTHVDTGPGASATSWQIMDTGDFNGDGRADLLWLNSNGQVGIWAMNADGTTHVDSVPGASATTWHILGAGNFNGDGKADILWRNDNGQVGIWNMVSATQHVDTNPGTNPTNMKIVGIGNFNGDGVSDILWRNSTTGDVSIWEMNQDATTFANVAPGSSALNWHIVGVGDFNGDGRSDILWFNDNGALGIWFMNVNGTHTDASFSGSASSWHIVGTDDYNGDGKSDILWHNDNGQVGIWYMNGTAHSDVSPGTSAISWQIVDHHFDVV